MASLVNETRLELEKKLDGDLEELSRLQDSLTKTNVLTDRMGSMLSSFEDRLLKLESSILPIHRATQRLTIFHENLDKALEKVSTIADYIDLASREEKYILKGPQKEDDIKNYLKTVSKAKEALSHLLSLKYRASEQAITHLKLLLLKAQTHFDILFKKWLTECSVPIDPLQSTDPAAVQLNIPEKTLDDLSILAFELGSLDMAPGDRGDLREHVKSFAEVRSNYLVKSLGAGAASVSSQDLKKGLGYVKGSNVFIPYVKSLLRMMKIERELIGKLIIKPQALACFQLTISAAVDVILETGEGQISRAKRTTQKREYNDIYMLIDTAEVLTLSLKEADGIISYAGPKGLEIIDLISSMKTFVVSFFKSVIDEIQAKADATKTPLPADGTVHEITSVTINLLRRLLEFESGVDMILQFARSTTFMISASTFHALATELLDMLYTNLDSKAKGYKKSTLSFIFLLNNFYYVHKQIKSSRLSEVVTKDVVLKYEQAWMKQRDLYRESWKPCFDYLMDTIIIQGGGVVKSLTKAQRDGVKDRFKNFNAEFESMQATQKVYAIPDLELRAQVVKEIKGILLPLYSRFRERYTQTEFSKSPEKYIKYDKDSLDAAMEEFFKNAR